MVLETCLPSVQTLPEVDCGKPLVTAQRHIALSTEEGAQSESSVTAGQTQCLLPAGSKEGHV